MAAVQIVDFTQLHGFSPVDGITGKALFGEHVQMTLVTFEPNTEAPMHSHPQEQLSIVLRGRQTFIVDDQEHELGELQGYRVPGNHPHAARSGPDGSLTIEVFYPLRNDYLDASRGLTPESFS